MTLAPMPQLSSSATPIIATAGEQLNTDYQVHELPGAEGSINSSSTIIVHHALLA